MRPPVAYMDNGGTTSRRLIPAFAKGCRGDICDDARIRPGDVFMFGSPRLWGILQQAIVEGRTWYYADHGYFGKGAYYRITRNRYQHPGTGTSSPERFRNIMVPQMVLGRPARNRQPVRLELDIKPWRKDGRHIVFCPPAAEFSRLMGFDYESFFLDTYIGIRKHTDRPIIIRRKGVENKIRPLEEDLAGAWALVSYNSNTLTQALLAGIPVIALAPWCAAATMGGTELAQIENPPTPDGREQWAWNLAANQWTIPEIQSGMAWRALTNA